MHHKSVREYKLNPGMSQMEAPSLMVCEKVQTLASASHQDFHAVFTLCFLGIGYFKKDASRLEPCISVRKSWFWECRNETICECGNISTVSKRQDPLLLTQKTAGDHALPIPNVGKILLKGTLQAMSDEWHGIVERYSAPKLSQETNRFPAPSDLAVRASPFLGNISVVSGLILSSTILMEESLC